MTSFLWLVCCTNLHLVFSTHVVINIKCTECLFYSLLFSSQKALSQIEKNPNLLPAMLSGKDKMGMSVLGNWALFRSTNFQRLWHALNVVCDLKIGWFFSEGIQKRGIATFKHLFKIILRKYANCRKILWKSQQDESSNAPPKTISPQYVMHWMSTVILRYWMVVVNGPTPCIYTYVIDVLWCQPIKLIHVVSTSEFHEYWWNDVDFIFFVPSI